MPPPYWGNKQNYYQSVHSSVLSHVWQRRLGQLLSDTCVWSADLQYLHACPQQHAADSGFISYYDPCHAFEVQIDDS